MVAATLENNLCPPVFHVALKYTVKDKTSAAYIKKNFDLKDIRCVRVM